MIHDPPVMIMDEPAAGLDPRARIQLREMIGQLAADGKAILVSSHILTELAEMCDTVAIIEQGRLLAVGTVEEIQRTRQAQRAVHLRVLGDAEGLVRDGSAGATTFTNCTSSARRPSFCTTARSTAEADMLRELVNAGIRVAAFGSRAEEPGRRVHAGHRGAGAMTTIDPTHRRRSDGRSGAGAAADALGSLRRLAANGQSTG